MDMEQAGKVISRILEDYRLDRDIDRMSQTKEPDKDEIVVLLEKLRRIVFPGYFRDKSYRTFRQGSDLQVSIEDAAQAERLVTILMGDKVDPRREYISQHANFNREDSFMALSDKLNEGRND